MGIRESGEMYLETVLILSQKKERVRSVDVGEYMGVSKPSVSRAMGILKQNGYITVDGKENLFLTGSGVEIASRMLHRHKLLTEFFVCLGVDETIAARDACRIEHDISDETFEALCRHAESGRGVRK